MSFATRSRRVALAAVLSATAAIAGPILLHVGAPSPGGDVAGIVGTPAASEAPPIVAPATSPGPRPPDPLGERSVAARVPAHPSTLRGYVWPLRGARLTQPFGPSQWGSRVVDGAPFHDGIDLATFCGDRIVAAHGGVVLAAGRRYDGYIGWVGDLLPYANRLDEKQLWISLPIVVVIDDGNDYRSMYAHFEKVVVTAGDVVRAGQLIGYEGKTGNASGCHLHYGLFSPLETRTIAIAADVVERMLIPDRELARIDPLDVLPSVADGGIH